MDFTEVLVFQLPVSSFIEHYISVVMMQEKHSFGDQNKNKKNLVFC
jgi:hypothetical protein